MLDQYVEAVRRGEDRLLAVMRAGGDDDLAAGGLLLRAQVVGARLQGASRLVGFEKRVDDGGVRAFAGDAAPEGLGVGAHRLEVDHVAATPGPPSRSRSPSCANSTPSRT